MRFISILASAACLAASVPALASDTVHLIDQSTINSSGGFPYKITTSGSYQLTSNITVPANTDGIVINADHVNLDLNGYNVRSSFVCSNPASGTAACPTNGKGIGIRSGDTTGAIGHMDVKISNGSVHAMGSYGIFLTGLGSRVDRVSVDGNGGTGMLVDGVVASSSAISNGNDGIFAIIVSDSIAFENGKIGIQVDASGGIATGNQASFNGGVGIDLPNGTASHNAIVRNVGAGIHSLCLSVISENMIVNNTGGSLALEESGEGPCTVVNNAATP